MKMSHQEAVANKVQSKMTISKIEVLMLTTTNLKEINKSRKIQILKVMIKIRINNKEVDRI